MRGTIYKERHVAQPLRVLDNGDLELRSDEAAEYLDVAPGTLYNWNSSGVLKADRKFRGKLYYRKSSLDRFMEEGSTGPEDSR